MLKQQDISQFKGFGKGDVAGKYFFSSGFKRTEKGAAASWRIVQAGTAPDSEQYWFAQAGANLYSVGSDGDILASGNVAQAVSTSLGNGLIADQKGRLLYARREHLGKLESGVFTDAWKDLGDSIPEFRPMELFEDLVLIGNRNKVAVLNTSDDSLVTDAFTLPTSFQVRCIKTGATGVLLAANLNNRGYLILWNPYTARSLAPWIYLPENVLSVCTHETGTWLVTTRDGIYLTNGYAMEPYAELPVREDWSSIASSGFWRGNVLPSGTLFHKGHLYVGYTPDQIVANKPLGVWIHDAETKLWEHAAVPEQYWSGGYVGALYLDSSLDVNVSWGLNVPSAVHRIGRVEQAPPSRAVIITDEFGKGASRKYAEAFIADLRFTADGTSRYATHAWTVDAKVYDFRRQLNGYGLTNAISASANLIRNSGHLSAYQSAQVGDEVTVLDGVNAGEIRHISSIANAGTNTETWTLDAALPSVTASGTNLLVQPFRRIDERSVSEEEDYFFNVKRKAKGKKFLVKLVLETEDAAASRMTPEIESATFIYDDNPTV